MPLQENYAQIIFETLRKRAVVLLKFNFMPNFLRHVKVQGLVDTDDEIAGTSGAQNNTLSNALKSPRSSIEYVGLRTATR